MIILQNDIKNDISMIDGSLSFSNLILDGFINLINDEIDIIFKINNPEPIKSQIIDITIYNVPSATRLLFKYKSSDFKG